MSFATKFLFVFYAVFICIVMHADALVKLVRNFFYIRSGLLSKVYLFVLLLMSAVTIDAPQIEMNHTMAIITGSSTYRLSIQSIHSILGNQYGT
jgi:hypothetical protein